MLLRGKFGFSRVTISDAGAVEYNYKQQKICDTPEKMTAARVNNGTDISIGDENRGLYCTKLRAALEQGLIAEEGIVLLGNYHGYPTYY